MNEEPTTQLRRLADHVYRTDSRRVVATLVRLLLSFLKQRSLA
jgi:hypothetical protein